MNPSLLIGGTQKKVVLVTEKRSDPRGVEKGGTVPKKKGRFGAQFISNKEGKRTLRGSPTSNSSLGEENVMDGERR